MITVHPNLRFRENQDGTKTIELTVTINRSVRRYGVNTNLPLKIDEKFWDHKRKRVSQKHPNYRAINNLLDLEITKVKDLIYDMEKNEIPITHNLLREAYRAGKIKSQATDFFHFFERQSGLFDHSYATSRIHRDMRNKVAHFCQAILKRKYPDINLKKDERRHFPSLDLREIDHDMVMQFRKFLIDEYELMENTYNKKLSLLRTYTNAAINSGIITANPFANIKTPEVEGKKEILHEKDIEKIKNTEIPNPEIHLAKLRFLFACCTGLAFVDLNKVRKDQIKNENGKWSLTYVRNKISKYGREVYVPLISLAREVYKEAVLLHEGEMLFPPIHYDKYREQLKAVGAVCGISENLLSHTARYTCGTIMLNNNVPFEIVKKVLGHSKSRTTEKYAKLLKATVDDAVFKNVDGLFSDKDDNSNLKIA